MKLPGMVTMGLLACAAASTAQRRDIQIASVTHDSKSNYITPVAILRDGRLLNPILYRDPENDKVVNRFIHLNYPNGADFHLWQAGMPHGDALITGWEPGCYSEFLFHVKLTPPVELDQAKGSLALSASAGKGHDSFQRQPTAAEREMFVQLSHGRLSHFYPAINSVKRYEIHNLIISRASQADNLLLLGSISFHTRTREYWLFTIFEQTDQNWRPAIFEIHRIADLEDRKDAQEEDFLDQLDVDGDGTDEFFTRSYYYEATSFVAYGIRNGKWMQIYKSGIAGC